MRRWRVVGVGTLAVILAGCGGGTLESSDAPKPSRATSDAEVEIFMSVAATEAQLAAVTRALRRSDQVVRFRVVTREDAYREFKRLFEGQPDLIATTSPEALPASVRVTLVEGAALRRFADAAGKLPGVDEVKYSDPSDDVSRVIKKFCRAEPRSMLRVDAEVFLTRKVTRAQVGAIRRRLRASAAVKSFSYLTGADRLRELKRVFGQHRDLVEQAGSKVELPRSFRVELSSRGTLARLDRETRHLAGVAAIAEAGQVDALCR